MAKEATTDLKLDNASKEQLALKDFENSASAIINEVSSGVLIRSPQKQPEVPPLTQPQQVHLSQPLPQTNPQNIQNVNEGEEVFMLSEPVEAPGSSKHDKGPGSDDVDMNK